MFSSPQSGPLQWRWCTAWRGFKGPMALQLAVGHGSCKYAPPSTVTVDFHFINTTLRVRCNIVKLVNSWNSTAHLKTFVCSVWREIQIKTKTHTTKWPRMKEVICQKQSSLAVFGLRYIWSVKIKDGSIFEIYTRSHTDHRWSSVKLGQARLRRPGHLSYSLI